MKNKSQLLGEKVKIISDNDNYDNFKDKVLIVTHADNTGRGYDDACYPEMLCYFICEDGKCFPFALYEYEFEII
jgi:hypothetical protein